MAFMSINGLRISRFKAGALEGDAATTVKRQAKSELSKAGEDEVSEPDSEGKPGATSIDVTPVKQDEFEPAPEALGIVRIGGKNVQILAPDEVPLRILSDLSKVDDTPVRTQADVAYAARVAGQGNHPWIFKTADDDRLWKVSYGGQGKTTATVRRIE